MWWNDYVDRPWKEGGRDNDGFDCWGLVRVVYKSQIDVDLPRLELAVWRRGGDARKLLKAVREYSDQLQKDEFVPLLLDGNYKEFDLLWLRNGGPIHFAVMIDDKRFIHVEEGCDTAIEKINSLRWERKIRGVFRHKTRT